MQRKDRDMLRKMRRGLGIRQVWLAKQTGIYRTKLSDFELRHLELAADELPRVTVEPSARQEAYNKFKCPVCGAAPSARVEATHDAAVRLWETVAAQQGIIAS